LKFTKHIFSILFFVISITVIAQIPKRPVPNTLYNNLSIEYSDFISQEQAALLESDLQNFSNETSNQICIVIVDDLAGMDEVTFATEIINQWGIGQKKLDNGILILVKPTGKEGQRKLFIAVGYGLEGAIPDLATKQIREQQIVPYFKQGQFYEGLRAGAKALMDASKGEYNIQSHKTSNGEGGNGAIVLIIIIIVLIAIFSKKGGGGFTGGRTYYGGSSSSFGGFSRSSGGSSFGGFGGGRAGGGGSGGSW
jgi:uncharacterized protein